MSLSILVPLALLAIPIIAILGGILVAVIKLLKGERGSSGAMSAEEARLMQELHQGLERMEQRIEALETILLDHPDASASAPAGDAAAPSKSTEER